MRRSRFVIATATTALVAGVSCSSGNMAISGQLPLDRHVVTAGPERAHELFERAVGAAAKRDADTLCAIGVTLTCEQTLARLAIDGLPWPTTEPRVVHEGPFEGGYAITVCVGSGANARVTDFTVYEDATSDTDVRDAVYWSGDRLAPVVEAGAPTDCGGS